ncbi:MAG TPA: hypothetical protein VKM72_36035 [Thermoanaerobaculia bacterium]|nr:hypothetical protein [Thermoanaerobaculia bacterium]
MAIEYKQTVVGELDRIAHALEQGKGNHAGRDVSPAGPFEKSFVTYSVGKGTLEEQDGELFFIVDGIQYTIDGQRDGIYQAVFKAWFSSPLQLLKHPHRPEQTFDAPSPVEAIKNVNDTKAKWTFRDGSYIAGVGPAISYIAPLKNGGAQFWVSATAFLTNGGGRYEGCIGQETSLGSTYFEKPPLRFEPGLSFPAHVTHSFRVILGKDRGKLPEGVGGNNHDDDEAEFKAGKDL